MIRESVSLMDQTCLTVESLQSVLDQLKDKGAECFDSSRVQLIQSLLLKTPAQKEAVQALVLKKALNELEQLQADFLTARESAALQTDQLEYEFPEAQEAIQALFQKGDFASLNRLGIKYRQAGRYQSESFESLKALTRHLTSFSAHRDSEETSNSVRELLKRQEQSILASVAGETNVHLQHEAKELKSIRVLREFQMRQQVDDLVDQAIREQPENPGPINPHMLAIKSLVSMRELSQPYLDHFVEYLDTLFTLESQFQK